MLKAEQERALRMGNREVPPMPEIDDASAPRSDQLFAPGSGLGPGSTEAGGASRPFTPPEPRQARQPKAVAGTAPVGPPLTEAEAAIFTKARQRALELTLAFLARDLSKEYDPALRAKLELKQIEIAQGVLALGGRIDPSVMRGQTTDEVGEMLKSIRGGVDQP